MRLYAVCFLFACVLLFGSDAYAQFDIPSGAPICADNDLIIKEFPSVVALGDGTCVIVWVDYRNENNDDNTDIYAQRLDALGNPLWGSECGACSGCGVPVCTFGSRQNRPIVSYGTQTGIVVAWEDYRFNPNDPDIFVQKLWAPDGSSAWDTQGVVVTNSEGRQADVSMTDGAPNVLMVYADDRPNTANFGYGIKVQLLHFDGPVWDEAASEGKLVCYAPGAQTRPKIVSDGTQGAYVVWEDALTSKIYAHHILANGNLDATWTAAGDTLLGKAVCTTGGQIEPVIVAVAAGNPGIDGPYIAWTDSRNPSGGGDIYMQKFSSNGTPQWIANGLPICTSTGAQGAACIALIPYSSTAIVAWEDWRSIPSGADIFAQSVTIQGQIQMDSNGENVSGSSGSGQLPSIVGVGDGAIVAWQKFTGDGGVYAQYLADDGDKHWKWAQDGEKIAYAPAVPYSYDVPLPLCSDPSGGAIVVWVDNREFYSGLYAQRLDDDLAVSGVTPALPRLLVATPRPNPFSSTTSIEINIASADEVSISVYDVAGRRVAARSYGVLSKGLHVLPFESMTGSGKSLPSGVYFCRVSAAGTTVVRKMVIAR